MENKIFLSDRKHSYPIIANCVYAQNDVGQKRSHLRENRFGEVANTAQIACIAKIADISEIEIADIAEID